MRTRKLPTVISALWLSACATDVSTRLLPRDDGTISAISVAREEAKAAGANVDEANRYCEKHDATAVFIEEETEYQGVLTKRGESATRIINKIPILKDNLTSDEDYQVTTGFKCQPSEARAAVD